MDRQKVINIALNEVGYLEKSKAAYQKNPNIIYDKTQGAGEDNYQKYSYEMHKLYPSVMDFPAAWCFVADSMVLTEYGYKAIQDLQIGDKVLNAYGNQFNTVIDKASREKTVLEMKAYGTFKLQSTKDHPFLSNKRLGVRKDWKHTELTFNPLEELKHGDNVIIPHTQVYNNIELSNDEAWCIGYFVGDGWLTSRGKYRICGNDVKEEKIYQHFIGLTKDKDYPSRTCYEYQLDEVINSHILPILNEVGKGANNKKVPYQILFANNNIKQAFLEGYITADGTKDYKFNTSSKELALGIAKIAFDLGYGCSLREQQRKTEHEIFDPRYNAYRKIKVKPILYCGAINFSKNTRYRMDRTVDELVYVPIKYNNDTNTIKTVYNITTDGDHTFIVNNLSVHNCDAFIDWCMTAAYGASNAKEILCGNFDDYTLNSCRYYEKANRLDTIPQIGDQIFFTKNGKSSGCYHTGLVYNIDSVYVYTIEGNTSNANTVVANGGGVAKKKYILSNYKNKVLFGHPKYNDTLPTTQLKSVDEVAQEVLNGKWGSGSERRAKLTNAGYNYSMVQARVNELVKSNQQQLPIIDLSHHNTVSNWNNVANNVSGVILRLGYRSYGSGQIMVDKKYNEFLSQVKSHKIPYGIYFFPTSITEAEAEEEANFILTSVRGLSLSFPIYLDSEIADTKTKNGRSDKLDKATRTKLLKIILDKLKSKGYDCGVYASTSWLNNQLIMSQLNNYKIWVAQYNTTCTYGGKYNMWQYSSKAQINGVNGNCDVSKLK